MEFMLLKEENWHITPYGCSPSNPCNGCHNTCKGCLGACQGCTGNVFFG